MSAEENKAILHHYNEELWNKGNLAVADEVFAPECITHDPASPEVIRGPEGYKQFVTIFRSAIPDLQLAIEDIIAEGDKVMYRWTSRGTHKGDFLGIAPTGKQVMITGMGIDRIIGGKVVESWMNYDMLGMLQQLGVVPPVG